MVLGTPIFDQGTGTYTTIAQVVARSCGVPSSGFGSRSGTRTRPLRLPAWRAAAAPASTPAPPTRRPKSVKQELIRPGRRAARVARGAESASRTANCAAPARGESVAWEDLCRSGPEPSAAAATSWRSAREITGFVRPGRRSLGRPRDGRDQAAQVHHRARRRRIVNPIGTRARSTAASCRASATR